MGIEILDAQNKDLPIINNLFRLYYYDLSTVTGWNCQENGMFEGYAFGDLSRFWNDDDKFAFVVRVDCRLARFALIDNVGVNTLHVSADPHDEYRASIYARCRGHFVLANVRPYSNR